MLTQFFGGYKSRRNLHKNRVNAKKTQKSRQRGAHGAFHGHGGDIKHTEAHRRICVRNTREVEFILTEFESSKSEMGMVLRAG